MILTTLTGTGQRNDDALPFDGSETLDADGDGVGDSKDVFPNDANESSTPMVMASEITRIPMMMETML